MIDDNEINHLAHLARINIEQTDKEKLSRDMRAILTYVEKIKSSSALGFIDKNTPRLKHANIMRKDENPHDTGLYTDALLDVAPRVKDNYIEVKKIIV